MVKALGGVWRGGCGAVNPELNVSQGQHLHVSCERTMVMADTCQSLAVCWGQDTSNALPALTTESLYQPHSVGIVNNPVSQVKLRH